MASSQTPLVSASGVTKRFPGVVALDDVHVDLYPGEVHALVGENGAGKSSFIKVLSGFYQPDQGVVLIDGKPMQGDVAGARAAGVATIHQEHQLIPYMSVAENVVLPRWTARRGLLRRGDLERRARVALNPLIPDIDLNRLASTLSPGVGQLVEVARGLAQKANVLILDEPTTALSIRERERLFEVIHSLRAEGMAILYVSHNLEDVKALSDRITVFRNGRTITTGVAGDFTVARLVKAMVGRGVRETSTVNEGVGDVVLSVNSISRGAAVRDVSFDVRAGEVFALVGLEGSGRTEVARCIFGVDRIESGHVALHGERLRLHSVADGIAAGIGLVPEERKLEGIFPILSVRENISVSLFDLVSRLGLVQPLRDKSLAKRSVRALGIHTPDVETAIGNLSGGNQQKTILARWITRDCSVLILDEPTKGIDIGAKAEIYKLIKKCAAKGTAIILISSDLDECLPAANRFGVMRRGRLVTILEQGAATKEQIISIATESERAAA